jgi:hypothetical protein
LTSDSHPSDSTDVGDDWVTVEETRHHGWAETIEGLLREHSLPTRRRPSERPEDARSPHATIEVQVPIADLDAAIDALESLDASDEP